MKYIPELGPFRKKFHTMTRNVFSVLGAATAMFAHYSFGLDQFHAFGTFPEVMRGEYL